MNQLDLSVIIANYNKKNLLKDCINSIYKNVKGIKYEIIVIDDGSSDGSPEFIKKSFPKVKLIINKKNLGPIVANNIGLKNSKGKYCLILDNDTIINNNVFKQMIDFMNKNPEVGVTGCNLVYQDGSFQKSMGAIFKPPHQIIRDFFLDRLFPNNKITNTYLETQEAHKEIKKVGYVCGACYMLRRKTMEEVGLVDEQYYMYAEELDWFYRIMKKGWDIIHLPYGPVVHFEGATARNNKEKKLAKEFEVLAFKNSILFYKKNYGLLSSLSYRFLMFISLLTKYTKTKISNHNDPIIPDLIKTILFSNIKVKNIEPRIN